MVVFGKYQYCGRRKIVMKKPRIWRKRYIPDEIVDISSDEILFRNEELIITKWKTIKPRKDISWGISYAYLKEGYKISRFYDEFENFLYWYCDILEIEHRDEEDLYILKDLLVDVKIYPNGKVEILDLDELAVALETDLITKQQVSKSLMILSKLLKVVDLNQLPKV
jgi:predicted RNA-binding protein associated with RNAse of E/G family